MQGALAKQKSVHSSQLPTRTDVTDHKTNIWMACGHNECTRTPAVSIFHGRNFSTNQYYLNRDFCWGRSYKLTAKFSTTGDRTTSTFLILQIVQSTTP